MKRLFFLAALSIAGVQPAQADLFKISVDSAPAPVSVDGQDVHGRVFIDFPQLAAVFGAVRRPSKDGELWVFPEHTLRFLPDGLHYKVRLDGDKTWRDRRFDEQTAFGGVPGLVPITALPELFQRSFSYHVQRRRLSVRAANADASRARRAPARHTHVDENDWVSLDDAAKALGVVVLNTQPNHYRLVLPDFTVLEIQVGDNSVVQRGVPFTRLPDPLLLFGGLPYVTSRSLQGLFGNDVRWDPRDAELVIPARYGRLVNAPSVHTLDWEGVREKPLSLRIDELSSFYQEPEPVYPADTAHVYESVRDLRTNEPIQSPNSTPEDRVSGTAVLSLDGTAGGLPVDGRGSFEKVGRREHVVNGSIGVGFPGLRVEGGRMYTTFDGLAGQFNAVDRVTVSHSNDTYGDGDKDTEVVVRAGGGEHTFDMFLSTSAFSQTVSIQQKFAQAGGDVAWRVGEEKKLTLRVDQYLFSSKDVGTSSSFFDEDLLREIFGDQFDFSVDPTEAAALTRT
ncbi:MAG: hypothetical protein JO102_05115, partial [Elusimicrobia bacterium]|nr:hypothetical protein [Elusimicrobiota bacterium]